MSANLPICIDRTAAKEWLRSLALGFAVSGFVVGGAGLTSAQSPPPTSIGDPVVSDQVAPDQPELRATPYSDNATDSPIEYLTRGPLHEAYAETYQAEPQESPLIAVQPPEPVDEVPPGFRPEGDNVTWISGYWAWDEERTDFLWVSGVWRQMPPGQRWVPGYWTDEDTGFRWISGFWTSSEIAEVSYLPIPPKALEQGPSAPAPSEEHFYVPGNWVYQTQVNDYQWQPGFWSRGQENWVWIPAQYIWTPRGTIYRQGYWDYNIDYRGVVFTPIYFRQPVYQSPRFTYRPRYTIDTGLSLFVHLFVRPNQRQYYFGDYYGPRYSNDFIPWVTRFEQPQYYDPFYANYRYQSRNQPDNVLSWVTTQHQYFEDSEQYRPRRTIAEQALFVNQNQNANISPTIMRLATFGESLDNVVRQNDLPFGFRQLDRSDLVRFTNDANPMRELSRNRRAVEARGNLGQADARPRRSQTPADVELAPAEDPDVRDAIVDRFREGEMQTDAGANRGQEARPTDSARPDTQDTRVNDGRRNQATDRLVLPPVVSDRLRRDGGEARPDAGTAGANEAGDVENALRSGDRDRSNRLRSDGQQNDQAQPLREQANNVRGQLNERGIDERLRQAEQLDTRSPSERMRTDLPGDWPGRRERRGSMTVPVPGVPGLERRPLGEQPNVRGGNAPRENDGGAGASRQQPTQRGPEMQNRALESAPELRDNPAIRNNPGLRIAPGQRQNPARPDAAGLRNNPSSGGGDRGAANATNRQDRGNDQGRGQRQSPPTPAKQPQAGGNADAGGSAGPTAPDSDSGDD